MPKFYVQSGEMCKTVLQAPTAVEALEIAAMRWVRDSVKKNTALMLSKKILVSEIGFIEFGEAPTDPEALKVYTAETEEWRANHKDDVIAETLEVMNIVQTKLAQILREQQEEAGEEDIDGAY